MRVVVLMIATGALIGLAPAQTPGGAAGGPGSRARQGGARIGDVASVAVRSADSRRIRTSVTNLLGWRVGIPANVFRQLTFSEAAAKADALGLAHIQGFSTQKVSPEIPRNLDYNLTPDELTAVRNRLRELRLRMPAYHVDPIPADEIARRKLFEFAKSLGVETIVSSPEPASLAALDQLANEFGVNVAVRNRGRQETPAYWDPKRALGALEGRSQRVGVSADLGSWMQEGIQPLEGLRLLKDRLIAVNLRDRSAPGAKGREVVLGSGAAGVEEFLLEMSRLQPPQAPEWPMKCGNCSGPKVELKPLWLAVDTTGAADTMADLSRSLDAFEKAVRPAMGYRVGEISRKTPITSPDQVPAEERMKIEAALPRQAVVKPKKPRKLLVIDLCPAGGYYHATIAHANFALGLMGKFTGAYEAVFSNDLDNLTYPKVKQFDAVFLNSTVGALFPDPKVLNGLTRFVREGGGLAGIHGASYASLDLPEYTEMLGAGDGPHRIEPATLKNEDPESPLNAGFGGKDFEYTDEYYRFLAEGPYSRDKLRVLLSIHVQKTDVSGGRPPYLRPDNDYGLSWIKSYGKGRVFNCAMGHTPTLFMTPPLAQHILAGIQFVLGDLRADTTPSARLAAGKQK